MFNKNKYMSVLIRKKIIEEVIIFNKNIIL